MPDNVFGIQLNAQSVSSTSEIPFFVAPYDGYIYRATYAHQLSVVPNPGTAGEGLLAFRIKNVTKGTYLTSSFETTSAGVSLLEAFNLDVGAAATNNLSAVTVSAGDVFTANWTATSASAGTGPGIAVIGIHMRVGKYGQVEWTYPDPVK